MSNMHVLGLLETIAELDRNIGAVMKHADALARSRELEHLRNALDQAALSMRELRFRALDSWTHLKIEHQELCLRTRGAVVLMQLADLRDAEHELSSSAWRPRGRFQRVHDLGAFLLDQIGRINSLMIRARRESHCLSDYGLALVDAQRAFSALGAEPDVVSFLEAGELAASVRFSLACRTLSVFLDADADGTVILSASNLPS